ncbi:GDCCVxC domain-containing (seleno)protein [Sediminibacterium sp.]|uniref:GDCCVxC domain-containing (seleno)protein n=1 Tax=Sediminibacterium sp. TaxID=1917865 RepID=UPI0025ECA802|nr:GDCCVxC domain-containing (seleno)protein [Sediminibacterium sp.]
MAQKEIETKSIITCPVCKHEKIEDMPTDACQYFYQCENCRNVIRPKQGDCCVYCSYGTAKCPPMQQNSNCC